MLRCEVLCVRLRNGGIRRVYQHSGGNGDGYCWELVVKRPKTTRYKSRKCIRLPDNLKH